MRRILLIGCCALFGCMSSIAQIGNLRPVVPALDAPTAPGPITIPAGTHIMMLLKSPLHTTSAVRGSGVYLETAFPVIENGRLVIPAYTAVLGEVERGKRPGRVRGRSQLRLRFTSFILPNQQVLPIAGSLQSLPGSRDKRTVDDSGTLEPVDQIDADVYRIAKGTLAGVVVGGLFRGGMGALTGGAAGAGVGIAKVLFTRGDAISLPVGTEVEMVLRQPLIVQPGPSSRTAERAN